jgi:hypothetical protein
MEKLLLSQGCPYLWHRSRVLVSGSHGFIHVFLCSISLYTCTCYLKIRPRGTMLLKYNLLLGVILVLTKLQFSPHLYFSLLELFQNN